MFYITIKDTNSSFSIIEISALPETGSGLTCGILMDLGRTLGSQLSFNLTRRSGSALRLSGCHLNIRTAS